MEYVIGFAACMSCVGGIGFLAFAYMAYYLKDAFKAFL